MAKPTFSLIFVVFVVFVFEGFIFQNVESRINGRHHIKHHGRHHNVGGRNKEVEDVILAPPTGELTSDEIERGLKGSSNPLLMLQKNLVKCTTEGSYGIRNECYKYVECSRKGSSPVTKFCSNGKFFDHLQRICVRSSFARCTKLCPEEGSVYADPNDVKGFLRCVGGVPMPQDCPSGEYFSASKLICGKTADSSSESYSYSSE